MTDVPTSLMAAITMSAATGKNPWLPFGLLFAVAAPASVPELLIDPSLHASLHALARPEVLYGLAAVFLGLGTLESLADKLPFIERWLVPVSTAWRPFASVALSSLIAYATLGAEPATPEIATHVSADLLGGVSMAALIIVAGSCAGVFATLGKTAARLLLAWVPVPGLRLLHSFGDDLFTVGAVGAGLVFADSLVLVIVVIAYFIVGLVLAPAAGRLAAIHLRIALAALREARRHLAGDPPTARPAVPPVVSRWLARKGASVDRCGVLEGWVLRAQEIGWCRRGYLVMSDAGAAFLEPRLFGLRCRAWRWDEIGRMGLAESLTNRTLVIEWQGERKPQSVHIALFAAPDLWVWEALRSGTSSEEIVEVRANSPSARRRSGGFSTAAAGGRFRTADELGDLRLQALLTLGAAGAMGVLSAGMIIPVGFGYLLSPFRRRFWAGVAVSSYLCLCVIGSALFGWPAAVAYAIILNGVCLRDLARQHAKARVDGYVDLAAFLPPVCGRVWVPAAAVASASDLSEHLDGSAPPNIGFGDASWRELVATGIGPSR